MARQFDVVVEKDSEGFFVASVPALIGCQDIEELDFVGVQRVTV
jgi:hypothetical protein